MQRRGSSKCAHNAFRTHWDWLNFLIEFQNRYAVGMWINGTDAKLFNDLHLEIPFSCNHHSYQLWRCDIIEGLSRSNSQQVVRHLAIWSARSRFGSGLFYIRPGERRKVLRMLFSDIAESEKRVRGQLTLFISFTIGTSHRFNRSDIVWVFCWHYI